MMLNKKYLKTRTFWDCDFDKLDVVKDREFMVSRLVQRGSDLEMLHLHSVFTYAEIYEILKHYMGIPKVALEHYKIMANAGS